MIIKNKYKYKEGFNTKIKTNKFKKGINIETIKKISYKRNEPSWMLKIRLNAFNIWKKMSEPHWINGKYKKINYQKYIYYSSPKPQKKKSKKTLFTKKVKKTFNKLKVSVKNKDKLAIDMVFDSVSVKTTYKKKLLKLGIIFCSFNEAIKKHPKIVKKYLCKVVPINDNFFSTLNTAVSSDGTFIYIPKNTICPIYLSTYFRINTSNTGQFERTLIILKKNSTLNYIEGCSAPIKKKHQLHAAVIEIILHENSKLKYFTIQNWFSGDRNKNNGILNFVTKRALCKGKNSKMSWLQIEIGSAITWKYPSIILNGNNSKGYFYSISFAKLYQQIDTGTKMIHIGKNTKSYILSKSISIDSSKNTNRSLVKINKKAKNTKNFTKCDALIIGNKSEAHTIPCIICQNNHVNIEHETTSFYIKKKQIFYLLSRGINKKKALEIIMNGFCQNILDMLPMEFSLEAKELISFKKI